MTGKIEQVRFSRAADPHHSIREGVEIPKIRSWAVVAVAATLEEMWLPVGRQGFVTSAMQTAAISSLSRTTREGPTISEKSPGRIVPGLG